MKPLSGYFHDRDGALNSSASKVQKAGHRNRGSRQIVAVPTAYRLLMVPAANSGIGCSQVLLGWDYVGSCPSPHVAGWTAATA